MCQASDLLRINKNALNPDLACQTTQADNSRSVRTGLKLATPLLLHQLRAYSLAENGVQSLDRFRAALLAMESVSAERGPANGALGADALNAPALRLPLINARAESDRRLTVLRSLTTSQACPGCTVERASVDAVQTQLVAPASESTP